MIIWVAVCPVIKARNQTQREALISTKLKQDKDCLKIRQKGEKIMVINIKFDQ